MLYTNDYFEYSEHPLFRSQVVFVMYTYLKRRDLPWARKETSPYLVRRQSDDKAENRNLYWPRHSTGPLGRNRLSVAMGG